MALKILFISSLLCVSLSVYAQNFSGLDAASAAQLDGFAQAEMNQENMVGLAIGVIQNGAIVYLKGYGMANQDCGTPVTTNTSFRIASISKTFTAIAALQLWEQGRLNLQADIRNYVPEYPVKSEGAISMEHLLSNEGGLQHYSQQTAYNTTARDLYIRDHPDSYDPIAAIDIFKNQPLVDTPGSSYNYTTFGFNLAAAVIERADTSPFEDQVQTRIAQVADMPSFQPAYRAAMPFYQQASGYIDQNAQAVPDKGGNADYDDVSFKMGGGGWMASVRDLTHFVRAFIADDLLLPTSTQFMGSNHDPSNSTNYGLGIFTAMRNGDTLLFHSGNQAWTSSLIYFSPENHNGVVVLCNNRSSNTFPLARSIYDNIASFVPNGNSYSNPIPTVLTTPIPEAPVHQAQQQNLSVWAKWQTVDYAQYYELEYADNTAFNNATLLRCTSDSLALNTLLPNQTYYWQVRARNDAFYGGISGNWSAVQQFSTSAGANPAILPFLEDFEQFHVPIYSSQDYLHTGIGYSWSFESNNPVGRAKFGNWSIVSHSGKGALTLDGLSTNGAVTCSKFAVLSIDLSAYVQANDLELSFDYMQHGEESHSDDKIWLRADTAQNWVELYDWYANRAADGVLKQVSGIDIDAALQAAGQSVGSSGFQLRFGQRDNSYAADASSLDGVTFDNILLQGSIPLATTSIEWPQLSIYPNPSPGLYRLETTQSARMQLFDKMGTLIMHQDLEPSTLIDISAYAAGVYLLRVQFKDVIRTIKLIKI